MRDSESGVVTKGDGWFLGPSLVDTESSLARAFGIAGIPSTVVVDPHGEMRYRVLGALHPGDVDSLVHLVS